MSTDFSSKLSIGKAEGLEPLINLLASPDPDVQKNSVQAICNLVQVSASSGTEGLRNIAHKASVVSACFART